MRIEGPLANTIVEKFLTLLENVSQAAKAFGQKAEWEFELLHRRSAVTEAEIEKEQQVMKLELEAREKEARVRLLELEAREQVAKATKVEAAIRHKIAISRQTRPAPPAIKQKFPPLDKLSKGEDVKKEPEGLTHSLGEKLKNVVSPS